MDNSIRDRVQKFMQSEPKGIPKWPSNMTAEDVAAIHIYLQESPLYGGVNGALGGWGVDGFAALPHYLPYIKLLMIAFDKLWADDHGPLGQGGP